MNEPTITIRSASVKVMRSYDYCHFEVCLSTTITPSSAYPEDAVKVVDGLRKAAARLADKAVSQYKVAKNNFELLECDAAAVERMYARRDEILETPEADRTPEEQALLKTLSAREHRSRPRYDYQDSWEEPDYSDDDDQDSMF